MYLSVFTPIIPLVMPLVDDCKLTREKVTRCQKIQTGDRTRRHSEPVRPEAPIKIFFLLLLFSILLVSEVTRVSAHEIIPSITTIDSSSGSREISLEIETNLETMIAGINLDTYENTNEAPQAETYNNLRLQSPEKLKKSLETSWPRIKSAFHLKLNGQEMELEFLNVNIPEIGDPLLERRSTLTLKANSIQQKVFGERIVTWSLDEDYGDTLLRIKGKDQELIYQWVPSGVVSKSYNLGKLLPQSWLETSYEYLRLGFLHIVPRGMDHILFVVALFLISPFFRPLLLQITSFTIAHTTTIALGALGLVSISPQIVEPLIAASIIFVAIENLFLKTVKWWRTLIIFVFGLLHGMGFAGIINEIGLPQSRFFTALVSFNVGVEIGQLAIIVLCFALFGFWMRKRPSYGALIRIPGSLLIAFVASLWLLERLGWIKGIGFI